MMIHSSELIYVFFLEKYNKSFASNLKKGDNLHYILKMGEAIRMQHWIKEVARGKRGSRDLTYEETLEAARTIISGEATDAQIAAYFIAQRLKTESSDELLAFVHAFQENCKKIDTKPEINGKLVDFASPYTGRNLFATTIPCAILLSEFGIPVILHSSESLPPKYGTSLKEIIHDLGVNTNLDNSALSRSIESNHLGFAWTDQFCPPLEKIRGLREELGVRTLLNTIEKLLNLGNSHSILLGAFHRTAINKIAPIFSQLSYKEAFIVQGVEGSEDLPVHRNSFIFKLSNGETNSFIVKPEDFGMLAEERKEKLTIKNQTDLILALLSGEKTEALGYYYKQVLFNTGIRYFLFGVTSTIEEGIAIAKEQLQSQRGLAQLNKWRAKSNV
jgi:anthranilate phosphoribosyltransferase